ncbi:DNA primase [Paraperlucidibaca wandonensis]|uniref:DNA primase n=1 Tax=Paraperlucidibaca wandonensis TaxID=1268273 RepID=A0ABW3HFZ6_9GAMM|nr:DNA primase [Paraperlucidibaca sp.]|tara:strand:- start:4818 stop:6908 length:2091 start_codon:yes stop_codon:yes gene_type:complete
MSAGRIPQSFIDEVLLRTDVVDLIDARVKLKRAGKNYSACCPFHQEKSPSFTVNREKQFYYCFGCGATGNALSFLIEHDRLDFIDGLRQLAGAAGLTLPETRDAAAAHKPTQQPLFDALERAAVFFEQQLRSATQKQRAVGYLKNRGVSGAIAKQFRIGYAPPGWDNMLQSLGQDTAMRDLLLASGLAIFNPQRQSHYDAMRDRVIFPIRDFRGRVIAFGGRVLNDDKPKYLNSPESPVFHKGQELYGLYEARQSGKLTRLLVVEGYMDVVALAQAGIHEAVATLGTATSTTHVERLFRVVPEVVFCFDGDSAGRRAAWRALENALPALRDGVGAKFLFLPDGEDPDSLVRKEGAAMFRARIDADSVPLADQLFKHLSESLNLASIEGRTQLATVALPLLMTMPESLFRTLLLQRLSEITQLSVAVLEKQLAQMLEKHEAQTVAREQAAKAAAEAVAQTAQQTASTQQSHRHAQSNYEQNHQPQHDSSHDAAYDTHWAADDDERSSIDEAYYASLASSSNQSDERPSSFTPSKRPFTQQAARKLRPQAPARPGLRSLSAQAIRLLLREPSHAQLWPEAMLGSLNDPETELLCTLAQALREAPERSLAALLGSWHGRPEGEALASIAAAESLLPDADSTLEAEALSHRLHSRLLEQRIAHADNTLQKSPNMENLLALTLAKREFADWMRQLPQAPSS